MQIPILHIDAFTERAFAGNPAAVCPLASWLPDSTLQAIAAENNLAETAFLVAEGPGEGARWALRWFTPTVEVDLCGHATLASAFALWREMGVHAPELRFSTRSGELRVTREAEGWIWLDFPARPPKPEVSDHAVALAMGSTPEAVLVARDHLLVYRTEEEVRRLAPEMERLRGIEHFAVIATAPGAPGSGVDFVSRFFAPRQGIDEDPVTGSAHCTLIPYWAERLGKTRMRARQVSARGGELRCELDGHRVRIGGQAVLYARGTMALDMRTKQGQDLGQNLGEDLEQPGPVSGPAGVDERWMAVDRYIAEKLARPDAALEAALAANAAAGLPAIDVLPGEGKLLQMLAEMQGARAILEIGTLGGYSSIWLARALPPGGWLVTLEANPKHAQVARENLERAGVSALVDLREGPALESLPKLAAEGLGPFDLFFIDADKENNAEYLRWALRLARPGSLIVVDNVIREGAVADANSSDVRVQGARRLFDALAGDAGVEATALQTVGSKGYDGFAIARVKG
jgi:PhzF family phenazine biosynthesis protein